MTTTTPTNKTNEQKQATQREKIAKSQAKNQIRMDIINLKAQLTQKRQELKNQ
jgi:hypothetical protein